MLVIGSLLFQNSFAGKEDWNGHFTVKVSDKHWETVNHSPTKIQFLFITSSKCILLGKGAKINGIEIKENIQLCTDSNIETFETEVQKLGMITDKSIIPGSSYTD